MAQDIRDLIKNHQNQSNEQMSKGHEARFLNKLDRALPEKRSSKSLPWMRIAASVVILLGMSFGAFKYFESSQTVTKPTITNVETTKSLGDVSPDLKKVEDYYMATINYELSKVKPTPENKELIDGYIKKLEELNKEYKRLSKEITEKGPNELTVNALITNLKLRLNLLYRLKEQLNTLQDTETNVL